MAYPVNNRERDLIQQADALNAIMAQSSIPQGAFAAEQRDRTQAQAKQDRIRRSLGLAETETELALRLGSGMYQGSSMEAQMLNIWNNPNIPDDDPRKQQAKAYLSRPTTISTPYGMTVRPGILGGESETIDKPPSEQAIQQQTQLGLMQEYNANASNYIPGFWEGVGNSAVVPDALSRSILESDNYKQMMVDARAWSAIAAKLLYGAASDDEFNRTVSTYWPQQGDTPDIVQGKAKKRAELEAAISKGESLRRPDKAKARVIDFSELRPE